MSAARHSGQQGFNTTVPFALSLTAARFTEIPQKYAACGVKLVPGGAQAPP